MKIYTKTGDKGTTSLVGGTRIEKDDIRIESYGTIDELNSNIGMIRNFGLEKADDDTINIIQNKLFSIGSFLATPDEAAYEQIATKINKISEKDINNIENEIDRISEIFHRRKALYYLQDARLQAGATFRAPFVAVLNAEL